MFDMVKYKISFSLLYDFIIKRPDHNTDKFKSKYKKNDKSEYIITIWATLKKILCIHEE